MANKYDKDYYEELKSENYKTLLDSEIQLDNARQRAMQNSQTQLNAMGMGSSGYGSTVKTGLESQYLSGLQNAQNAYQDRNMQIGQQQRQAEMAEADDRFNSLTALMGQAQSQDDLNKILSNYGYRTDSGWNEDALAGMSQDDRLQLQSLYTLFNSQIANSDFGRALEALQDSGFTNKEDLDRYLTAYGLLDDKGNLKTDNYNQDQARMLQYAYEQALNNTSSNQAQQNASSYQYNGGNYSTDFGKGYGTNTNFNLSVGNTTFSMEVGNKASSYQNRLGMTTEVANSRYADKQTGEVWAHENNGKIMLLTKDNDGNVRVVEVAGVGRGDLKVVDNQIALLNAMGINATKNSKDRIEINGKEYLITINLDGSFAFNRQ